MNRHLAIKISCFSVVKLGNCSMRCSTSRIHAVVRNSPAQYSVMARVARLESKYFNHNLLGPDLVRASLTITIPLIK